MISFVVPAHNEAQLLGATLSSLHRSARAIGAPYEIVVVDDTSTDATAQIAAGNGARVVSVAHRHIAATRNAGARAAEYEYLFFVDADTVVNAAVLHASLAAMRGGAVGGGATIRMDDLALRHHRWITALGVWFFLRVLRIAPGCFLYCTRSAFESAGGFDETLYAAEDVVLSRALSRQGRFALLRESVSTSSRKLRTFPMRDHLRLLMRFALHGKRMLRSRDGLGLWYEDRRKDP